MAEEIFITVNPTGDTINIDVQPEVFLGGGFVENVVYTTGDQAIGGAKTFNQIIHGSIDGNAATVANGVYTTGDQTIGGAKTFSETIVGSINGNAATANNADFVTNGVYTTGDQTIGGLKDFSTRPTVNSSGVVLEGEIPSLPDNLVYTDADQTISGDKTFNADYYLFSGADVVFKNNTVNFNSRPLISGNPVVAENTTAQSLSGINLVVTDDQSLPFYAQQIHPESELITKNFQCYSHTKLQGTTIIEGNISLSEFYFPAATQPTLTNNGYGAFAPGTYLAYGNTSMDFQNSRLNIDEIRSVSNNTYLKTAYNNQTTAIGIGGGNFTTFSPYQPGAYNIAIGQYAQELQTTTSASAVDPQNSTNNIAIGFRSQERNARANSNISIGTSALRYANNSTSNVAIGTNAMLGIDRSTYTSQNITSEAANNNIAIGGGALQSLSQGKRNVVVGVSAGQDIKVGQANTLLGYASKTNGDRNGTIVIGHQATGHVDGTLSIKADNLITSTPGTNGSSSHLRIWINDVEYTIQLQKV